ncbi:MAG: GAF domain-containing sensor histidine kinase [Leptolyngbya sp. SIO3F4]|nr:GAF domain-containing sensor histidine kinase [Leptolyngbya sp. SIO3F4]
MVSNIDLRGQSTVDGDIQVQLTRERALNNVITKIRDFLDLELTIQTTVVEVRQLLNADRVGVLRLDPSYGWDEGTFVAESVLPRFDSVLAARVRDHCFGRNYAKHYCRGKVQALDDVDSSGLAPCYLKVLQQFQVKANLLAPLVVQDKLWGLLCIHQCFGPRHWESTDIEFARQIASHLSVAIEHAERMEYAQHQAQNLHQTLDLLKETHTDLAQTEKMSGLACLAAGVAHEINNPVTFIQGNLDYLQESFQDLTHLIGLYHQHCECNPKELEHIKSSVDLGFMLQDLPRVIESITYGTERIQNIVNALSQFSRLDNEGYKLTDLNQELDNTLLLLQHYWQHQGSKSLTIEKHYSELPKIECSPGLINQVFMHLIENAADALESCDEKSCDTTQQSKVIIKTKTTGNSVKVDIRDNGPGIKAEQKAQLFDPFFTTKPVGQGTGLGLAISYNIVAKHNGKLKCESKLGKGTVFTVELPIHQSVGRIGKRVDGFFD